MECMFSMYYHEYVQQAVKGGVRVHVRQYRPLNAANSIEDESSSLNEVDDGQGRSSQLIR